MLEKNMSNVLPVIGMVLFLIIVSMMLISYFGVNMNITDGIRDKANYIYQHQAFRMMPTLGVSKNI